MEILIASDHAGYSLKQSVIESLKDIQWRDLGPHSDESVDYPDYAIKLCKELTADQMGILICGSGQGMAMTANKFPHIRAALCWSEELASLAREHNNANVLALPARFIDKELAFKIIKKFMSTRFEGGRHERRVNKIKGD